MKIKKYFHVVLVLFSVFYVTEKCYASSDKVRVLEGSKPVSYKLGGSAVDVELKENEQQGKWYKFNYKTSNKKVLYAIWAHPIAKTEDWQNYMYGAVDFAFKFSPNSGLQKISFFICGYNGNPKDNNKRSLELIIETEKLQPDTWYKVHFKINTGLKRGLELKKCYIENKKNGQRVEDVVLRANNKMTFSAWSQVYEYSHSVSFKPPATKTNTAAFEVDELTISQ